MAVLMFWNIAKKDLSKEIGEACREHRVNVLILAECELSTKEVLLGLNGDFQARYEEATSPVQGRVRFFTNWPTTCLRPLSDDGKVSIRALQPPIGREIIVAAAHLSSKLHANADDQHLGAGLMRGMISRAEKVAGHQNTIVIGDLNMNPFEKGMVAANGFHAMMDKRVVARGGRVVQGAEYDFFYNPMWSRLGDESGGPPGTYYLNNGGALVNHYWETFDQILLRPALLPSYKSSGLKVLDRIADKPLLKEGVIDHRFSDHLPLVIELDVEGKDS